jgi:hypothetical protein
MADIIMAESIDVSENTYKFTIDLIDINTISFNIMNTDTGVNYKLYIKKDDEWCNRNLYKIQNDFGQLYQILNDCVNNDDSEFEYDLSEEKDNINFKISMKKETKFFKLDLEFNLKKHISENGSTSDKVDSLEYRFNIYKNKTDDTISQLKEDNKLLKKQVEELIDFKLKLQEKNKKEYDWLNTEFTEGENRNCAQDIINWYACPDYEKKCEELDPYAGARPWGGPDPDNARGILPPQHTKLHPTFLHVLTDRTSGNDPSPFWKRWFRFHMEKLLI